MQGSFVFGEGVRNAVMLIGEGPGAEEEAEGRPFVGQSGELLRKILDHLKFNQVYMTNTVCCRSCAPITDMETGLPVMRKDRRTGISLPIYKDEPPTPAQCTSCLPRLYEQIYLVDPVVIVGLGGKACETLLKRPVTITRDRGETRTITIPGAGYRPLVTKDGRWRRKVAGVDTDPVEPNEVRYHLIPTLHPAYVSRLLADRGPNNPFEQLMSDLRKAIQTYETYVRMAFGEVVNRTPDQSDETFRNQFQ